MPKCHKAKCATAPSIHTFILRFWPWDVANPIRVSLILLCYVWYHELGFGTCLDRRQTCRVSRSRQIVRSNRHPKAQKLKTWEVASIITYCQRFALFLLLRASTHHGTTQTSHYDGECWCLRYRNRVFCRASHQLRWSFLVLAPTSYQRQVYEDNGRPKCWGTIVTADVAFSSRRKSTVRRHHANFAAWPICK